MEVYDEKRVISLVMTIVLAVSLMSSALASDIPITIPNSYVPYSSSVSTREEWEQNERKFLQNFYDTTGAKYVIAPADAMPIYEDPGDGAVRIVTGNMVSSGTIYWDSHRSGEQLSAIASLGMTIYDIATGSTVPTVISIVKDLLTFTGITEEPEMSRPAEVKRGHSVSYINKVGEFYYNSNWETAVVTQQRQYYEHRYSTCVVNGKTTQCAEDRIPENGYSAYLIENSANFNNTTFINNKTLELYSMKKQTGSFGIYEESQR